MPTDTNQQEEEPLEKQLCTSCATPNNPSANFCIKCGAPVSSLAMITPFERLFAEGFIYRQAAEHPRNLIAVLGIWFLFGMMALAGLMIAILAINMGTNVVAFVGVAIGIAITVVSMIMIFKTTRNYRIASRDRTGKPVVR